MAPPSNLRTRQGESAETAPADAPEWLGSAAILDQIPDGVIVADAAGRIVLVNEAAALLHGVKRLGVGPDAYSEAYGLFTLDGRPFPPDSLPLARALAGETVTDARWIIRRPDGSERVAIGTARPFLDEAGRRRGAILTLRDDSGRHRAELAAAESEARFRTIADCAPCPVWVTGRQGIEFVNRAYAELAQRSAEELLGHNWIGHFHEDDILHILGLREEAWRNGTPYAWEARFQRAGGEWVWIRASCAPRFDSDGEVLGYVGMAVDVSDSHRVEAELRSSEALLRAMFDNAGVGMVLMDRDCIIAEANSAFAEITGRSEAELPGSPCLALTHPDDVPTQQAVLESLEASGGAAAFEKRYVHRDGHHIWVRITLSRVGEQVLAVVEDVTARKTAEVHLRLMVDELNHRVKNTLAIVQGLAQQSFRGVDVPTAVRRSFEGRLIALATAHNLLTRANWESAELTELAREVLGVHSPGRFSIDGPPVRLEPKIAVSLAMALHELCTNAVKYGALSRPEGQVDIGWAVREADPARLTLRWEECGGPPVAPPARRGFGTRMIERALAGDIGGSARLDFRPTGVVCEIEAPLTADRDETREQAKDGSGGQAGAGGRGRADRRNASGGHAA